MSFEPMNCAREQKWRLCSGSNRDAAFVFGGNRSRLENRKM